jgi:hypothetical protein
VVVTAESTGLEGTPLLLARLAIIFAAASASYYLVELPVRNGALRGWRSWVVVPTGAGALVAGAILVTADARPVVASDAVARAASSEVRQANREATNKLAQAEAVAAARPTSVLMVGDSVALTLGLGLQEAGLDDKVFTVNRSQTGCGITHQGEVLVEGRVQTINGYCDQVPHWAAAVQELKPDLSLMLIGAWDAYDRRIDGQWIGFGAPEWDALMLQELQAAVDALSSAGGKVVFATVPHFENRYVVNRPPEFKSAFDPWRVDHLNALLRQVAQANADRVGVVDLAAYLAPPERRSLLEDGVHFGPESRKIVGDWLAPQLHQLAR